MPTQTVDLYNPTNRAIQYAGPDVTWTIAKGVNVGSDSSMGVFSNHARSTLINKGTIYSISNVAAQFTNSGTKIENKSNGVFTGHITGLIVGPDNAKNVTVKNDGMILSTNIGLSAQSVSNFKLYNTGMIEGNFVAGINHSITLSAGKNSLIDNSGTIRSDEHGIFSVNPSVRTTEIINRKGATIEGDTAAIHSSSGKLDIANKGKIHGDIVSLGAANDKLVNGGQIKGDVFLGSGKDTYKNDGGKAKMVSGGPGNDTLIAGPTRDKFLFDSALNANTNVDRVKKFKPGTDEVILDQTVFSMLFLGDLPASQFRKGKEAKDGNDFIIYHKKSGKLFYDPDGDGASPQTLFARFDKGTSLSHNDFTVIA